jgi:succinyl-diaminopimelate desuccinylase
MTNTRSSCILKVMKTPNLDTIQLAKDLIEKPSITPFDAGCQALIAEKLLKLGFSIQELNIGGVQNLIAIRNSEDPSSESSPLFAFAGHTDVVPAGDLSDWQTPPFTAIEKEGFLYGRGSADMKGSLAAMVTAVERFLDQNPKPKGSIAFLITSDEEGDAEFGTRKIMEYLREQNITIHFCIVGEPTSHESLGDVIKIGRRGSMSGRLKILGKQGHIAYPHRADNPIHRILMPLRELAERLWDNGDEHFPPTSFQISNINAGTGAGNVIPGALECLFNFRFSPGQTAECLQNAVHDHLKNHALNYELEWKLFGTPFITPPGNLISSTQETILDIMGYEPKTSTDGGTSDARFIAGPDTQVIELGPCNSTIHAVNERVGIQELQDLSRIYEGILARLLA